MKPFTSRGKLASTRNIIDMINPSNSGEKLSVRQKRKCSQLNNFSLTLLVSPDESNMRNAVKEHFSVKYEFH